MSQIVDRKRGFSSTRIVFGAVDECDCAVFVGSEVGAGSDADAADAAAAADDDGNSTE